jgi:hypothetical protein
MRSETDTELIAHLISDVRKQKWMPLEEAVRQALTQVCGAPLRLLVWSHYNCHKPWHTCLPPNRRMPAPTGEWASQTRRDAPGGGSTAGSHTGKWGCFADASL